MVIKTYLLHNNHNFMLMRLHLKYPQTLNNNVFNKKSTFLSKVVIQKFLNS
jgi:hypothetical protein